MVRIKNEGAPEKPLPKEQPPVVREIRPGRQSRRGRGGLKVLIGALVILALGFGGAQLALRYTQGTSLSQLFNLGPITLKGESDGRVNLLVMGFPGDPLHDGPELTDTIMVASLATGAAEKNFLFSIPRDLYLNLEGYGYTKANSVFEIGERELQDAPATSKAAFGTLLELPLHYYFKVDFVGFEKLIDELGGVDVTVEKELRDPQYPDGKGGLELFEVKAGEQKMDGMTALKFARSRQTTSDFDRARRQQKLLFAVREKAKVLSLLSVPSKALAIRQILNDHLASDATWREFERMLKLFGNIEPETVTTRVFDDTPQGLLYGTKVGEQFVLKPVGDDYTLLSQAVKKLLSGEEQAPTEEKPNPLKIEVLNGTQIPGLAARVASQLRQEGHAITLVGNNAQRGIEKTLVYDLTSGAKATDISRLAGSLEAGVGTETLVSRSGAEARVVLGADAAGS